MKKWLFLIVAALTLANPKLNILPVEYQFDITQEIKNQITALQSPKQRKNIKIKQELESISRYYSEEEKNYLNEVVAKRESLQSFYQNYCLQKDFNSILYGDHLTQACKVIAKNRDLIR